jgi:hypothetical protein
MMDNGGSGGELVRVGVMRWLLRASRQARLSVISAFPPPLPCTRQRLSTCQHLRRRSGPVSKALHPSIHPTASAFRHLQATT